MTEELSDMERLRVQNLSLLKELQKGQRDLRASIQPAVTNRGSPSLLKELQKGQRDLRASIRPAVTNRGSPLKESIHQERVKVPKVKFQRIRDLPGMSSIQHKPRSDVLHSRKTSTPKYNSADKPNIDSNPQDGPFPNPPAIDPVPTTTPTHLYESFLNESHTAFGQRSGKCDKAKTINQTGRKTPGSSRKGKAGSVKRKSHTPRKSPKHRPGTSVPIFTLSPNHKGPRMPYAVQLETSSLLPPPLSEKENLRGQGSRYGYWRPLDLAHEESYYQLNQNSPRGPGPRMGQVETSFAGQLLAEGNERRQTRRSQEDTTRPKSILLTPGTRLNKSRNRVSFRHSPNASVTFDPADSLADRSQPLLGYDWITGLLDSDAPVSQHSEAFFDELRQFRQANREECVHKAVREELDVSSLTASFADDLQGEMKPDKHTCIHNYTLNPRLFAVPLHGTQTGESLCAVCNDRRKPKKSGITSPSYIRVSIPRSTLASPYRLRPHRRKSYDPTDSVGLSQHCLAGWQSSKPSMLPTASNIDLKGSVDKMASNALSLMSYPSQEPSFDRENAARISKHTQDLLNRSHALQLDLQKLERVGMSVARLPPKPHSFSYPVP